MVSTVSLSTSVHSLGDLLVVITNDVLSLFPNPARDEINIKINDSEKSNAEIKIIDIHGKELLSKSFEGRGIYKLSIAEFKQGMYFVIINYNGKYAVRKLIKTN